MRPSLSPVVSGNGDEAASLAKTSCVEVALKGQELEAPVGRSLIARVEQCPPDAASRRIRVDIEPGRSTHGPAPSEPWLPCGCRQATPHGSERITSSNHRRTSSSVHGRLEESMELKLNEIGATDKQENPPRSEGLSRIMQPTSCLLDPVYGTLRDGPDLTRSFTRRRAPKPCSWWSEQRVDLDAVALQSDCSGVAAGIAAPSEVLPADQ